MPLPTLQWLSSIDEDFLNDLKRILDNKKYIIINDSTDRDIISLKVIDRTIPRSWNTSAIYDIPDKEWHAPMMGLLFNIENQIINHIKQVIADHTNNINSKAKLCKSRVSAVYDKYITTNLTVTTDYINRLNTFYEDDMIKKIYKEILTILTGYYTPLAGTVIHIIQYTDKNINLEISWHTDYPPPRLDDFK